MRDKFIELIKEARDIGDRHCEEMGSCAKCHELGYDIGKCGEIIIADHLIANDVTIQRWIPVDEAKPKLIPNTAGTAYSDAVNALTSGRKVITAIWDGTDFIGDAEFWEAEDEIITHWTPVLLPLPSAHG